MRECLKRCKELNVSCPCEECRLWIDYSEDLNCTLHAVENNHTGELTLREVADRLGISFVRVKQIQDKASSKLAKRLSREMQTKNKKSIL